MFSLKSEKKVEAEPEKNQGRYNLRRRKDDGSAKSAEAKQEHLEEKEAKRAAGATISTRLDFGGKIGRLQYGHEMQLIAKYKVLMRDLKKTQNVAVTSVNFCQSIPLLKQI